MRKYRGKIAAAVLAMLMGLALLIGSCTTGSSSKPAETSTPPAVSETFDPSVSKIGATVNVTITDENNAVQRADLTVNSVRDLGPRISDGFGGIQKSEHGRFIVVTITYVGSLDDAFPYAPPDWSVRTSDGQQYGMGGVLFGNDYGEELLSGTLHKGQRAKGFILMDVPKTHGNVVYTYAMNSLAEWKF